MHLGDMVDGQTANAPTSPPSACAGPALLILGNPRGGLPRRRSCASPASRAPAACSRTTPPRSTSSTAATGERLDSRVNVTGPASHSSTSRCCRKRAAPRAQSLSRRPRAAACGRRCGSAASSPPLLGTTPTVIRRRSGSGSATPVAGRHGRADAPERATRRHCPVGARSARAVDVRRPRSRRGRGSPAARARKSALWRA